MRTTKLITILAASFCLLTVGLILNLPTMYLMCGVLFTLPFGGRLYARAQQRGLEARCTVPTRAAIGEHLPVEVTLTNRHPWPKMHLSVVAQFPPALEVVGPGEIPIHLPPLGRDSASLVARPLVRGLHRFGGVVIKSTDPLGLSEATTEVPVDAEVLVYPRVVALPPELLDVALSNSAAPTHPTGRRGEGNLFFGTREYQPGDPLRRVHWRSSARLGRLAVREMEHEQNVEVIVALETMRDSELGTPPYTSLEYGVTLAASLAALVARRGDRIRLVAPGWASWSDRSEAGPMALPQIMETLARLEANGPHSLEHELLTRAQEIPRGSCVFWITPRLGAPLWRAIQALRTAQVRVIVLGLDPTSYDPAARRGEGDPILPELYSLGSDFWLFRREDDPVAVFAAARYGGRT